MIQKHKSTDYYTGALHCLYQYAHWQNGVMYVGTTGRPYDDAAAEISALRDAMRPHEPPVPDNPLDGNAPPILIAVMQNVRINLINLTGSLVPDETTEDIVRRCQGIGADVSAHEASVFGNRSDRMAVSRGDARLLLEGLLRICLKSLEDSE